MACEERQITTANTLSGSFYTHIHAHSNEGGSKESKQRSRRGSLEGLSEENQQRMAQEQEFRLASSAFSHNGRIPRKFTLDGQGARKDESPPLEWYGIPDGTETLALIVEDPDAPDPEDPIVPWTHWVLINIPPTLKGIPANFTTKNLDEKSEYLQIQEGINDWKLPGYRGPNPPVGVHHYEFRLYALDCKLKLGNKATKDKAIEAMVGHVLGEAVLVGQYSKDNFQTGRDSFVPKSGATHGGPGTPLV